MKKPVNISLDYTVYEKARRCAEKMGVCISAFISILIANYKEYDYEND